MARVLAGAGRRWSRATLGVSALGTFALLAFACGETQGPLGSPKPYVLPSGSGGGSTDAGGSPTSCEPGQTAECHLTVGEANGILTCLDGVRTCSGGQWGPCLGSFTSIIADDDPGAQGMKPLSFSNAEPCQNNPCDPSCRIYDEEPATGGLTVEPQPPPGGTYVGGTLAGLPSAFLNAGLKDIDHPPTSAPCTGPESCQFDHRCDAATGACLPYPNNATDPSCNGIDLTVGATCDGSVPVCNRGKSAAPPGTVVVVYDGTATEMEQNLGLCSGMSGTVAGECVVSVPIPAGQCITLTNCPVAGTQSIVVNPPSPPASSAPVSECNCGNNWSVYHNGGTCKTASCQPDYCTGPGEFRHPGTNHCYRYDTTDRDWAASRAACQAWGGDLAALTTQEEHLFVVTTTTSDTWIGASDIASEGTFEWVTGEPWGPYTAWESGEPNDFSNQDCVEMRNWPALYWNDDACGALHNSLCERWPTEAECPFVLQPVVVEEVYQGVCPEGTHVQWGYLAYSTWTPGDSTVEFEARTAPTQAELSGSWTDLATAALAPTDTQTCAISPPTDSCPVNLAQTLLGPPLATNEYLELRVTLNPGTAQQTVPTVYNWQITYSCPITE